MAGRGADGEGEWRGGVGKFLVHDFFPSSLGCAVYFIGGQ